MTLLTSHYVLADLKVAREPGCSGLPNTARFQPGRQPALCAPLSRRSGITRACGYGAGDVRVLGRFSYRDGLAASPPSRAGVRSPESAVPSGAGRVGEAGEERWHKPRPVGRARSRRRAAAHAYTSAWHSQFAGLAHNCRTSRWWRKRRERTRSLAPVARRSVWPQQ
jgi:hypothetical protein